ncbi:MAG TPA: polyhydroxyalkanoic acid system family protein [Polyangiaceae bacterium]|nr:polyhydroxyalkanoic acid system family protein [Polyangiaceae bacterium]
MATIDIKRTHSLGLETAKQRAEKLADGMKEKLGIVWRWDGNVIRFDAPSGMAKGANGTVSVEEKSIRVEIDLPFMLRALKGTVESKVNEKLEQAVAG